MVDGTKSQGEKYYISTLGGVPTQTPLLSKREKTKDPTHIPPNGQFEDLVVTTCALYIKFFFSFSLSPLSLASSLVHVCVSNIFEYYIDGKSLFFRGAPISHREKVFFFSLSLTSHSRRKQKMFSIELSSRHRNQRCSLSGYKLSSSHHLAGVKTVRAAQKRKEETNV